jgi:EmrB/QacA subfamily drug resistance transporter
LLYYFLCGLCPSAANDYKDLQHPAEQLKSPEFWVTCETMQTEPYQSTKDLQMNTVMSADTSHLLIGRKTRLLVIAAALLALFLGALDALVVGAAMPTIVAELGGLHLYSWVFSSYLLTRSISLPIFGKLCDLLSSKKLYLVAIGIFVVSSICAGAAQGMKQLIFFRALQGIGAGGNFALAYIVIADLSSPEQRGKMMGLISFVWGVASVLGPALGGIMVNYASWRWIFYINLPLGGLALIGIGLYLRDVRVKTKAVSIDLLGALTLSVAVLALLTAFLMGGRTYGWSSLQILGLFALAFISGVAFYYAERRAAEPILNLSFFRVRGFSMGNGAAFFSSFAIFSISAYMPLFIQGALGKTPVQLGVAMIPLSLAWSAGALLCGQLITRARERPFSLLGSLLLLVGCGTPIAFSTATPLSICSLVLALTGLGMGFVSIGTLLMVQNSLSSSDLGVATSSHQFARTLGGTIGIGASGSLVTQSLSSNLQALTPGSMEQAVPPSIPANLAENIQSLFQPEVVSKLSAGVQHSLQQAIADGVEMVFWTSLAAAAVSLLFSHLLPALKRSCA